MKKKITRFLMLALALVWAIPQTSAQEYELTVNTSPEWIQEFTSPTEYARGIAIGSDLQIYTLDNGTTQSSQRCYWKIGKDGANSYSLGITTQVGGKICNDDAFNVIAALNGYNSQITTLVVFDDPANSTKYTNIDLNGVTLGAPHYIWAEGNVKSVTEESYIWYAVKGETKVHRITIKNMQVQKDQPWSLKDADGNDVTLSGTENYVHKYDTGRLYLQIRSGYVYDVSVSGNETECNPIFKYQKSTDDVPTAGYRDVSVMGGGIVMFKGHKLLFKTHYGDEYNTGLYYTSRIDIFDMSDFEGYTAYAADLPTPLATIDDFKTAKNGYISVNTWVRAIPNPDDENKLDIYIYKPGVGAAKYSITATQITGPVRELKSTHDLQLDTENNVLHYAVLSWKAPSQGTDNVSGYTIYRDDVKIATVGSDVLTYTDTEALAGATVYKVEPNYSTGEVGSATELEVDKHEFKAPKNLTATPYDGYARAQIQWTRAENDQCNFRIRYDLYRNGILLAKDLAQIAYMDTDIPEGTYEYTVNSVYYLQEKNGNEYNVEIARLSAGPVSAVIKKLDNQLVNYRIEEVYNYPMWKIWDNGVANGIDWAGMSLGNFNPDSVKVNSSNSLSYVDAEHYRQGALVEKDGKKYWYIAQKSTSWSLSLNPADNGPHGAGILVLSAEDEDLKKGGAPVYYKGADLPIEIKNGQTVGIAADDEGNIFVRGHNGEAESSYSGYMNFTKPLKKGVIYTPDMTKGYTVDLSSVNFSPERAEDYAYLRTDYYRLSGKLFSEGTAYLYAAASHARTMTVVQLKYDSSSDAVTVGTVYQYTPTAFESGKEIKLDGGSENYAFPIMEGGAGVGSHGYIYQRRGNAYFYVPTSATENGQKTDVITDNGKINNAGGTTVRMINEEGSTQLFLITPESYYSQSIGSFSVNVVTGNDFVKGVIPVATFTQSDIAPDGHITNVNGNWLFAEYDAEDKCIYIYQYVPGIRIAKYRLYGSISYYSVPPVLDIETVYNETEGDITHFKATVTWTTPNEADGTGNYTGTGDYVIRHYEVNLLDGNNKIIDTRIVDAADTICAEKVNGSDIVKKYTLTFNSTGDLSNPDGVETGGTANNYFVDDSTEYTVQVTAVYDSRTAVENNMIGGLRRSATQTAQARHSYGTTPPAPSIKIYEGKAGTSVAGLYRMELDLMAPDAGDRVSHYELYYTRGKRTWTQQTDGSYTHTDSDTTIRVTDFILVTSSLTDNSVTALKGQDVIPGDVVRNEQHAVYLEKNSEGKSYAVFFYDSNDDHGYDTEGNEWWNGLDYDPKNWTYIVKAVYADDNALLRTTTEGETVLTGNYITTGAEEIIGDTDGLKAYPIPADTELNVMSGQAIDTVGIYSTSGAEVKRVAGNGEMRMTIDVEDLASGYYFLKVNNLPPVKIIVR